MTRKPSRPGKRHRLRVERLRDYLPAWVLDGPPETLEQRIDAWLRSNVGRTSRGLRLDAVGGGYYRVSADVPDDLSTLGPTGS